jgi:hypothetical protein
MAGGQKLLGCKNWEFVGMKWCRAVERRLKLSWTLSGVLVGEEIEFCWGRPSIAVTPPCPGSRFSKGWFVKKQNFKWFYGSPNPFFFALSLVILFFDQLTLCRGSRCAETLWIGAF